MEPALEISAAHWSKYRGIAKELGFSELAAAPSHVVRVGEQVREWVAQGYQADMFWFDRSLEKRLDPGKIIADAASILVLTAAYEARPCTLAGKKLARYAAGEDYHDVLLVRLRELCARMAADYPAGNFRPYVDTGPVLERYWAQEAGLGWIGKNANLISREKGSYLFLACVVTNLCVPYGRPHAEHCGSCRACLEACPTGAIVADGVVDSNRCISYLSIEHRGPFEDAPGFEDWIFGCDICQEVCPWTMKFSGEESLDAFQARPVYGETSEHELASMDQEAFSRLFRRSPIKRTKLAGLQRNLIHPQRSGEKDG